MNYFISARIKLTAWYVFIIFLISSLLSGLYYFRTIQILDFQAYRIERQIRNPNFFPPNFPAPDLQFLQEEFESARGQLINQILLINLIILSLSALASFFLSGATLKPIQEALEEQKRFVADAAHELKTPITALKTSLEVNIMDKKISSSARKILQENLIDVNSLESLAKNLLSLASFDRHQVFQKSPISLLTVIDLALRHVSPLAKQKNIKIDKIIPKKPPQILGHQDSLVELFVVLLDNAIKYSPRSRTVKFLVSVSKKNIKIIVADHGIGIEPRHLPFIFDRFYRADQSRTSQNTPGYGLGLSVAKTIVSRHSGRITVKSTPGSGSTFTVILPQA
ncbi:HAMP domain-containing histidine kinase [Patescibacteria group bacterium]|nr:HAMP domain-containing histidine kinase [Patescibacteria group bacterium]